MNVQLTSKLHITSEVFRVSGQSHKTFLWENLWNSPSLSLEQEEHYLLAASNVTGSRAP